MRNVSHLFPLLPGIVMLTGCNHAPQKSNGQNGQKPNIIYIFADDLGIGDLSCYGATKVSTPSRRTGSTIHQCLRHLGHQYSFPFRTPHWYVSLAAGEHRHCSRKLGTYHRHNLRHHG